MALKFKVGDKVKIVCDKNSSFGKDRYKSNVKTIATADEYRAYPYTFDDDSTIIGWRWRDSELELVESKTDPTESKIIITTDGKTTLARLYNGKNVIKSAEANCHPEDYFNFEIGARVAVHRLLGVNEVKTDEDNASKFKVGQFVRVVNTDTHNFPIFSVVKVTSVGEHGIYCEGHIPKINGVGEQYLYNDQVIPCDC